MRYELECRYDTRKSFYGKAVVEVKEELNGSYCEVLYSYNTLVARYERDDEEGLEIFSIRSKYSQTTTRHQKEFFKQKGLTDKQIKEVFNKGVMTICK